MLPRCATASRIWRSRNLSRRPMRSSQCIAHHIRTDMWQSRLMITQLYQVAIVLRHVQVEYAAMMSARGTYSSVPTFLLLVALAGVLGLRCPSFALAQSYPIRTVTVVVPFPAVHRRKIFLQVLSSRSLLRTEPALRAIL